MFDREVRAQPLAQGERREKGTGRIDDRLRGDAGRANREETRDEAGREPDSRVRLRESLELLFREIALPAQCGRIVHGTRLRASARRRGQHERRAGDHPEGEATRGCT